MEHMVDKHSLRSRGTMEINMSVKSDKIIMKFGWWSSLTFLQYTHEQTTNLSKGVSTDTSNHTPFENIGEI